MMNTGQKPLTKDETDFAQIIGDLVEQWGFKRHLASVWCLLFLRGEPLSASDIQEILSLSAGSVSTVLTELQTWGVVRRVRKPADRNIYFEPESNIWRSISNVFRAREIRMLERAKDGLEVICQSVQKRSKLASSELQTKRLKQVIEVIDTALGLLSHIAMPSPLSFTKMGILFNRLKSL